MMTTILAPLTSLFSVENPYKPQTIISFVPTSDEARGLLGVHELSESYRKGEC